MFSTLQVRLEFLLWYTDLHLNDNKRVFFVQFSLIQSICSQRELTWQMQQVMKRSHWKYSPLISVRISISDPSSFALADETISAPAINLSALVIVSVSSFMVFSSIWYTRCEYALSVFRNRPISKFNCVIWPKVRRYQNNGVRVNKYLHLLDMACLPIRPYRV